MRIARRDFLRTGFLAALATATGACSRGQNPISEPHNSVSELYTTQIPDFQFSSTPISDSYANQWLTNLPDNIPGSRLIEKYYAPNAEKTVLFIKNAHNHPTRNNTEDEFLRISQIQNNIFDICDFLIRNYNMTGIRAEGYTTDTAYDSNHDTQIFRDIIIDSHTPDSAQDILVNTVEEQQRRLIAENNYVLDAHDRLALVRGVEILASEPDDYYERAQQFFLYRKRERMGDESVGPLINNYLEQRDNFLIYHIQSSDQTIEYVIRGGLHSIVDNLTIWNQNNSNRKISLAVVTPENY